MILKLKQTPGIFLVGFMGCGKSTVGRLLAKDMGWTFVDLDTDIETDQQMPIPKIFETLGEEAFRDAEFAALQKRARAIKSGRPMVVAVGGGCFAQPRSADLIETAGVSIWIDCALEIVKQRVANSSHRPLAKDPEKFEQLYHQRRDSYAKANYQIALAVDDSSEAFRLIKQLPIFTK